MPPPPATQYGPCHVFAASSSALVSKPFAGSPGTVYVRHTSFPVFRIVGGEVAAHSKLSARIADEDHALDDAGSARNGVGFGLIDGDDIPHRIAGFRVQRDEPAVERAEVYLALVEGDSAIDGVAADGANIGAGYFGIEGPQDFAGPCIERIRDAPLAGGVDHTVGDEGRRFEAMCGTELSAPEQAELADVLFVDQFRGLKRCSSLVLP